MRIALDAMGGDFAPLEIVLGASRVVSQSDFDHEIVLVGDESQIREILRGNGVEIGNRLSVRHAPDVIAMHEHPTQAVRKKRESSLVVCGRMVASGEAQATLSAGNTGAAMAIGALDIGRIPGVERPAIGTPLPTSRGTSLLVDAGANVDCSPQNLLQFGMMGAMYARCALDAVDPIVGLLNIGSEPSKGNELTKAAFQLLQTSSLRFYGNVEGRDVWDHAVDVVVCDGFAGNVLLKTAEGFAEWMMRMIAEEAKAGSPEDRIAIQSLLGRLFHRIDYSEHGSAPLLGVNGVSMISHGRSKAKAIDSALRLTIAAAQADYVSAIRDGLQAV